MTPSPFSRLASATVAGLVSTLAQTFAGVKTFTSAIIASAGIQLSSLWNTNGTGASDVGVKVGFSTADASVNSTAEVAAFFTGIGGTEVKSLAVRKNGVLVGGGGTLTLNNVDAAKLDWVGVMSLTVNSLGTMSDGYGFLYHRSKYTDQPNRRGLVIDTTNAWTDPSSTLAHLSSASVTKLTVHCSGRIDQKGDDSSASPGAATIHLPSGKSAIASGASSVRITNNLVAAGDNVHATMQGDCGQRHWCEAGAGFFDLKLPAAATADTAFCWTVSKRL